MYIATYIEQENKLQIYERESSFFSARIVDNVISYHLKSIKPKMLLKINLIFDFEAKKIGIIAPSKVLGPILSITIPISRESLLQVCSDSNFGYRALYELYFKIIETGLIEAGIDTNEILSAFDKVRNIGYGNIVYLEETRIVKNDITCQLYVRITERNDIIAVKSKLKDGTFNDFEIVTTVLRDKILKKVALRYDQGSGAIRIQLVEKKLILLLDAEGKSCKVVSDKDFFESIKWLGDWNTSGLSFPSPAP